MSGSSQLLWDESIQRLMKGEILPESTVKDVCSKIKEKYLYEPNLQVLSSPITIVGSIHGQFYDMLELFRVCGSCPDVNFLFLGDYISRGYFSVETITLLYLLKLRFPERITLLRGNHESRALSSFHQFYSECVRKYGSANVWKYFVDTFDYLTTAAVIDNRIFCVHGGLSPAINTLDQIRCLNRFVEIPAQGPLADLYWSDPDPTREGFAASQRGVGHVFGEDVVSKFLKVNNLQHVARSHQLCLDGYQTLFNMRLWSIWSAPNYLYKCGNVAAVCEISESAESTASISPFFNTFSAAPSSYRVDPEYKKIKEVPDYFNPQFKGMPAFYSVT